MDEKIKENLAIEIANKSLMVATLEAQLSGLQSRIAGMQAVLDSDEALKELFNEKMEELNGI